MEEKEYRHIPCINCDFTLRLTVSKKNYGRTVEVTCPTCGAKFQTTILDEKKLLGMIDVLRVAIKKAILEDKDVTLAKDALNNAGFNIMMGIVGEVTGRFDSLPESPSSVQSKVENDEIKPGTFSTDDEKWMREFKIKLNN